MNEINEDKLTCVFAGVLEKNDRPCWLFDELFMNELFILLSDENDVFIFLRGPMASKAVSFASLWRASSNSALCISFAFCFNLSCSGSSNFDRLCKRKHNN